MLTNLTHFFLDGGVLVGPLLLIFLLGGAVVFERLLYWKTMRQSYNTHDVELVYTYLNHKQLDLAREIYLSSKDPSLICLKHCFASKGEIHPQILQSLGQQILDRSKKFLRLLETLITISPLLGILGTVLGIIVSMQGLASSNNQQTEMMAGLSQALITTAMGLVIAIIYVIFYNHFLSSYENLKAKLERDLSAFESLTPKS